LNFDADLDFSISENPTLRFNFVPHGQGQLKTEVEDSKDGHWEGTLAVKWGTGPINTSATNAA